MQNTNTNMNTEQQQTDAGDAPRKKQQPIRECHKGAMIGEKATPEQIRLWQSLGIIK